MADNILFKSGSTSKLNDTRKIAGQLLFATDGTSGSIYLDKDRETRIKMNLDATKLETPITLTIGSTGKLFDGSTPVSWNLNEIGAYDLANRGTKIPDGSNLNDYTTAGNYYTEGGLIDNAPFTSCGYRLICQNGYTRNGRIGYYQIAFGDNNLIKFRSCNNNSWTDWNIDYLPLSGGTLTGDLEVKNLIIAGTDDGLSHLRFNGYDGNYICFQPGGCLSINANSSTLDKTNASLLIDTASVRPGKTNTIDLGRPGYEWKDVYAANLYGDLIGGTNVLGAITIKNSIMKNYPAIGFVPRIDASTVMGSSAYIYEDIGSATGYTKNELAFRVYSPTSSGATTINNYYEDFKLPSCNIGRTKTDGNATYQILTTKEIVTVDQGGTGNNIGCAPMAKKLVDSDNNDLVVGSASEPVYFFEGIPKKCTSINTSKLTAKTLTISGTETGLTHIKFSRENANYICFPPSENGCISINAENSASSVQNASLAIFSNVLKPGSNKTVDLGTSSNKWNNVYANTFYGALNGNASTATKLATERTLTIGNSGKLFNGNYDVKWTLNEIGALPGKTISATTPATKGWYRIASTIEDQGNNLGQFIIQASLSSHHSTVMLNAGISYGHQPALQQMSFTYFYIQCLTKARIVYNTSYSGTYAYLEVYLSENSATAINVTYTGKGWNLILPNTKGSIPDGYTSKEITFVSGTIVSDLNGNATTASKVGSSTSWLYFNNGNEVNFGGTSTATNIYIGCEATDSRPIPKKFIFGNNTNPADLQAKTVYFDSGTSSYISSSQYTGNAATATTATKATQDSDGNAINTTYLKLAGGTMTGAIITPGDDSVVIRPLRNNYDKIGSPSFYFYEMYSTNYYLGTGTADMSKGALKIKTINAPVSSDSTDYGVGSSGQVLKSNGSTVYWGTVSGGTSYTLPQATNNALGGVKIGYSENDKNYPVKLNTSGQMYVHVPWTSTSITDYCTLSTAQTITGAKTFKASPIITNSDTPKIMLIPNSTNSNNTYSNAYVEGGSSDVIKLWIDSNKNTSTSSRRGLELHGYQSKAKVSESLRLRRCDTTGKWLSDLLVYHQGNIVYSSTEPSSTERTTGMIWLKPI